MAKKAKSRKPYTGTIPDPWSAITRPQIWRILKETGTKYSASAFLPDGKTRNPMFRTKGEASVIIDRIVRDREAAEAERNAKWRTVMEAKGLTPVKPEPAPADDLVERVAEAVLEVKAQVDTQAAQLESLTEALTKLSAFVDLVTDTAA